MPETDLADKTITVEGLLEKVIYSSEDAFFTVARLKPSDSKRCITIVGAIMGANEGEQVRVVGAMRKHPRYGEQLDVQQFEVLLPSRKDAIEKYLHSTIKGVGCSLAARMVEKFGKNTLEIMDEEADRLLEVSGIGPKKLRKILESWKSQRENHQTMLFLASYSIRGARAIKIFKHYGGNTVAVLKQHPYRLAIDIDGIGFITADRIAREIGIAKDDPERIQAAIFHCLREASLQGHCFLPELELQKKVIELLKIDIENIHEALDELIEKKQCYRIDTVDTSIYLKYLYSAEYHTAGFLQKFLNSPLSRSLPETEKSIVQVEREMHLTFLENQREAIYSALTQRICIITGGPGVGKTTVVRALVRILMRKYDVALAAPTGRAAKRLAETTDYPASTIHRLLRYNPYQGGFEHDYYTPLKVDHLIIDETSMMDISLSYYLLRAIPASASITFVGDIDQLPSVGPGNFLKDLICSERVPVVELTHIFRQCQGSSIVEVAHKINKGEYPQIPTEPNSDILLIPTEDSREGAEKIVELASSILPRRYGLHPLNEIQVLTPMYRGDVGADNLNKVLAETLNPGGKPVGKEDFRVGDKVMQTTNNYEKNVYNGDIGVIISADSEEKTVVVDFDNRAAIYWESELEELVRAYAISIHKSQGSEYPAVIIPIFTEHYIMLQRNLLYTAITRGKSHVILVGSYRALAIAVRTVKARNRYTNLSTMLRMDVKMTQKQIDNLSR